MESRIFTRIFHQVALSCYILHMQYAILSFFRNLETPFLNTLANILSMLGEEGVMIFIMLIVYYVWDKRTGYCVFTSLLGAQVMTNGIKAIVRFPRPFTLHPDLLADRVETATGYSFPSGHTTGAAAFYPALARRSKSRWVMVAAIGLAILIGLSRNMLRVHWPADVVVGLFIGLVFSLAVSRLVERICEDRNRLVAFSTAIAVIAGFPAIIMAVLLSAHLIDSTAFSDLMKILSLAGGAYAGCVLEVRIVSFQEQRNPVRAVACILLSVAGVAVIMAMKAIFPDNAYFIGSFIRYFLLGFWATGLFPFIATRIRLMETGTSGT